MFIILHDFEMVTKTALDSGTRAYVLAAVSQDNLTCLATPLVVLYGAPTVRRRITYCGPTCQTILEEGGGVRTYYFGKGSVSWI